MCQPVHLYLVCIYIKYDTIKKEQAARVTDEIIKTMNEPEVAEHTFNSSPREAEAGGSLNLRPAWSIQ